MNDPLVMKKISSSKPVSFEEEFLYVSAE